ncbi:MAG: hypothetical protein WBG92_19250 [Thiohalocapsa sp.]
MRENPIAFIEFVAFIGLVIWLFIWQSKPNQSDSTRSGPTDADETRDSEPGENGSEDRGDSR